MTCLPKFRAGVSNTRPAESVYAARVELKIKKYKILLKRLGLLCWKWPKISFDSIIFDKICGIQSLPL